MADEESDYDENAEEEKQLKDEEEYEDEEDEEADDADPIGMEYNEIYYIEVADKQQGDQKGPIDYKEFKKRYQDNKNHPRLTYMSPIRDANEMPEWIQLFKCDKIFKDVDSNRYKEIKNKSKSRPKSNPTDDDEDDGGSAPPKSSSGLAQPMSIKEMKAKEAKEEEERLKNPEKDYENRPMIESDASYHSDSCCIIL